MTNTPARQKGLSRGRVAALGLIFSVAATVAAWFLIPAPFTAYTEIQVLRKSPHFFFEARDDEPSFEEFKQIQMKMAASPFVLTKALRDSEINDTGTLARKAHPVEWLEREIVVSESSPGFFTIALSGEQPDDLAKIVRAVTDSYMAEFVDAQTTATSQKLDDLETVHSKENQELEALLTRFRQLSRETRVANSPQRSKRELILSEVHKALVAELTETKVQRIKAEIALKAAGDTPTDQQTSKLNELKALERGFEEELDEIKLEAVQPQLGVNVLLQDLDKDIKAKEVFVRAMLQRIDELKIESAAAPRVTLFRGAEVPAARDTQRRMVGTAGVGASGLFLSLIAVFLAPRGRYAVASGPEQ